MFHLSLLPPEHSPGWIHNIRNCRNLLKKLKVTPNLKFWNESLTGERVRAMDFAYKKHWAASIMDKVLRHGKNLLFKDTPFKLWFYHPWGITVLILLPTLSQGMSGLPLRIYLEKSMQFQYLLEVLPVQAGLADRSLTSTSKAGRLLP